jgi:hypothetical protein
VILPFWIRCARTDNYLSGVNHSVKGHAIKILNLNNTQTEGEPLCSHGLYCVQNFETAVHFVNNMKYKYQTEFSILLKFNTKK